MNNHLSKDLQPYIEEYKKRQPEQPSGKDQPPINLELAEAARPIVKAFTETWNAYINSPKGQEHFKKMQTMGLDELQVAVSDLILGPEFSECREIAYKTPPKFLQTVTVGIGVLGALIWGGTAVIGVAFGVHDAVNKVPSVFLTLSPLIVGAVAEVSAFIQFGFWNVYPEDLWGWSNGVEADFDYYAGVSIGAAFMGDHHLGIVASVGIGLGVGAFYEGAYTFVRRPSLQFKKDNLALITRLYCKHTSSDGLGHQDEIFLTFESDEKGTKYRFPRYSYYSMEEDHDPDDDKNNWYPGRSIYFDHKIHIKVYDDDGYHSARDKMGSCTIHLDDFIHPNDPFGGPKNGLELVREVSSEKYKDKYYLHIKLLYHKK